MFKDRTEAANILAERLKKYREKEVVVLAIPRGGLPIGAVIARSLDAPLDVALSKKIGHPHNREYAIGAASTEGYFINRNIDVPEDYVKEEINQIRALLGERHKAYHQNSEPANVKDKWVILVDDGIATGNTILVTVALIAEQKPAGVVVAIPVAPPSSIEKLLNSPNINEVICLETPYYFQAVGQFYQNFDPVSDKEAIKILEDTNRKK